MFSKQKVNGLAVFVDSAIEIPPLPLHFNIRLIHAPTGPDGSLAPVKGSRELGAIFDHPPVNGGVVHVNPTFFHEFLDVACAQRVRHIPAHPHENDLWGEMGTLKTDCHHRSPLSITVGHRERSYRKSPHLKICDIT